MREKAVYTVGELAELTGLSRRTITRLFEKETGVLILERPEKTHKRRYRSIRIPRAVYERVIRKITVDGATTMRTQCIPQDSCFLI